MIPNHNEKKETTVQVTQVVELGVATNLTMGPGRWGVENHRPRDDYDK